MKTIDLAKKYSEYDVLDDRTADSSGDTFAQPAQNTPIISENVQALDEVKTAKYYISKGYLDNLSGSRVQRINGTDQNYSKIRLLKIQKIVYSLDEDPSEKLLSVYNSLIRFTQNVVLLIKGDKQGAEIYIGVRSSQNVEIAGEILKNSYAANFPGSVLKPVEENATGKLLTDAFYGNETASAVSILSTIPSLRGTEKGVRTFTQGLEKFIDTMRGYEYTCELIASPVSDEEIRNRKQGLEELYSALFPYSKRTMSHGHNDGVTMTTGISESISRSIGRGISLSTGTNKTATEGTSEGRNIGTSMIVSLGFNYSTNESNSIGHDKSRSVDQHEDESKARSVESSKSVALSTTDNLTIELKNRSIDSLLEIIDKHIARFEEGYAYGLWSCAAYFAAPALKDCAMAAGTFKSLMAGDYSNIEQTHINYFDSASSEPILQSLQYCMHPQFSLKNQLDQDSEIIVTPTSIISGKELPLFIGFPRKSVYGLQVTQMAEFGRNIHLNSGMSDSKISIGHIHYMNNTEMNVPSILDAESFTSHCFITGSTGSGKSNTVYKLIDCLTSELDRKIPFLVIEPAKGEYKKEFGALPEINIFTANPFEGQFLKLNPFYFNPKVHILEHLDRLIEIFNACWEMYAAMPAILKDALERAYIDKGWDLINSVHQNRKNPEYPTFRDLLDKLPVVINESSYSADTKGDYKGALVTRVNSLTNGIYGQIFCDTVEIDEQTLFDKNTIIDLSRIGSSETKSLIMGILVLKLSEYRMASAVESNRKLQHITILEEAHNLLKNTRNIQSAGGNSIIAKSVEMITAGIAEMRTYGEGFVIVDQSPTSVDIAAIKNTNTKIVMRLPEKDDCLLAGAAMALNAEQTAELSKLETGVAVVMQNNWTEAVMCKIDKSEHADSQESQVTDIDTLIRFRSVVANAVVNNFILKNGYDESEILEQIENFDINMSKKIEMKRYITSIAARLRSLQEAVDKQQMIGLALMKILGYEDIFRKAEKMIRVTEDKRYDAESMQEWRSSLIRKLNEIVDGEARGRKIMFQYMLFAKSFQSQRIDYSYLYRQYYVR